MVVVDDWRDLPPFPVLVRREGKAVAAYRNDADAYRHAMPLEDARVDWDRCTGLTRPSRPWVARQAQRERDRGQVEALHTRWLEGCNTTEIPAS
jgi:hypothetical protein